MISLAYACHPNCMPMPFDTIDLVFLLGALAVGVAVIYVVEKLRG